MESFGKHLYILKGFIVSEVNKRGGWHEALHAFVRSLGAQFATRHVQDGHEV